MSVYTELLRQVLRSESHLAERSVGELVALVLARRAVVTDRPVDGDVARSPSRLGDALSYDAVLIHLCDRLEVSHDLLGPQAGPVARQAAEDCLADRLPALATTLGGDRRAR